MSPPSGASPWNGIFGRVKRSKYNIWTLKKKLQVDATSLSNTRRTCLLIQNVSAWSLIKFIKTEAKPITEGKIVFFRLLSSLRQGDSIFILNRFKSTVNHSFWWAVFFGGKDRFVEVYNTHNHLICDKYFIFIFLCLQIFCFRCENSILLQLLILDHNA